MYGNMNAVNMRTNGKKQKWADRLAKKERLYKLLEHGDLRVIQERINLAAAEAREAGDESAKGISYHSVRFTLNPEHRLYSERVIIEAERLFAERQETEA